MKFLELLRKQNNVKALYNNIIPDCNIFEILPTIIKNKDEIILLGGIELINLHQQIKNLYPDNETIYVDSDPLESLNFNIDGCECYLGDMEKLKHYFEYKNKYVSYYLLESSYNKNKEFFDFVTHSIRIHNMKVTTNNNTSNNLRNFWNNNIQNNVSTYLKTQSIDSILMKHLDMPCVILMAGPSLDKNVKKLIKNKNKCITMAPTTLINKLTKLNFTPDYYCVIDCQHVLYDIHFKEAPEQINSILLADSCVDNRIFKHFKHIITFNTGLNTPLQFVLNDINPKTTILAGGTVASTCFEIAMKMGFNPIVFIGFDLAYTKMKSHTKNSYECKIDKNSLVKTHFWNSKYKMVLTSYLFITYIEWFMARMDTCKQYTIIDATEGGMNKPRFANMKFKQVVKNYFTTEISKEVKAPITPIHKYIEFQCNLKEAVNNLINECNKILNGANALNIRFNVDRFIAYELINKKINENTVLDAVKQVKLNLQEILKII